MQSEPSIAWLARTKQMNHNLAFSGEAVRNATVQVSLPNEVENEWAVHVHSNSFNATKNLTNPPVHWTPQHEPPPHLSYNERVIIHCKIYSNPSISAQMHLLTNTTLHTMPITLPFCCQTRTGCNTSLYSCGNALYSYLMCHHKNFILQ